MTNNDYAAKRAAELIEISKRLKDDETIKRELNRIHNRARREIQREIQADITGFAVRGQLSMVEAQKLISKTDVQAFSAQAKRYVNQAERIRRSGRAVKYSDFTPEANASLRAYNVTMRTNRQQLLEARVNLITADLSNQEQLVIQASMEGAYVREYTRQAGILNISVPSERSLQRRARAAALSDVSGIKFSDRIWRDQKRLTQNINNAIEDILIRGVSPLEAIPELNRLVREEVGNKAYKSRRIAVTETARAQSISQTEAFVDNGIEQYIWIAEPDACPICAELDGKVFPVGRGTMPPDPHPNCRCSTAAYVE